MNLNEYQNLARRTICPQGAALDRIDDMPAVDGVMLMHSLVRLSTEVGELARVVERYVWYRQEFSRLDAIAEAGDILWSIAEVCTALGISLEEVAKGNNAKLKEKFPDKFDFERTKEENRNRALEDKAVQDQLQIQLDADAPNYEKDNHA